MRLLLVTLPVNLFKLLMVLFMLATPILGFWLVSSMATFLNGPLWVPLLAGVLLFPLMPLLWEWWAAVRWKKKETEKERSFTFMQRMILRVLFVNLLFLIVFLVWKPQKSFIALSTRGDWMLDGQKVQTMVSERQRDTIRKGLFTTANGLEWVYNYFYENPYDRLVDDRGSRDVKPEPSQLEKTSGPDLASLYKTDYGGWPWPDPVLHDAVREMPRSVETSYEEVARHLAEQESDPYQLVKAVHDYVADRVKYDTVAFKTGNHPPQDAKSVFLSRKSVCAGYANLFAGMIKELEGEVVIVSGHARSRGTDLSGYGHAWNAVKIKDKWYLVDATWDSGYVNNYVYTKRYTTNYLFPPPEIMVVTHFPEKAAWQLLEEPLNRGEFLRQPWMKPRFFANGLKLVEPTRSLSDVSRVATISLENPRSQFILAKFSEKGKGDKEKCSVSGDTTTEITCTFDDDGTYEVNLFGSYQQYGTYDFLGRLEFNNRM